MQEIKNIVMKAHSIRLMLLLSAGVLAFGCQDKPTEKVTTMNPKSLETMKSFISIFEIPAASKLPLNFAHRQDKQVPVDVFHQTVTLGFCNFTTRF